MISKQKLLDQEVEKTVMAVQLQLKYLKKCFSVLRCCS